MKILQKQKNKFLKEKGASLFMIITVLAIMSAVILGLIAISLKGIKIAAGFEHSVFSFYAANTGIEESLYELRQEGGDGLASGPVGSAQYTTSVTNTTSTTEIISIGTYRGTKRVIRVTY
jgi:hypothetical protein